MQDYATLTVRPEIEQLIERTIREAMKPYGFRAARVRAGEDHDGDPVLWVEVEFDFTDGLFDYTRTSVVETIVRASLLEHGEMRFAHFRYEFDERQKFDLRPYKKPRRRAKT